MLSSASAALERELCRELGSRTQLSGAPPSPGSSGWERRPGRTELQRLKGDLGTDSHPESLFRLVQSLRNDRNVKERIKRPARYRRRKCRDVKKCLEFESF